MKANNTKTNKYLNGLLFLLAFSLFGANGQNYDNTFYEANGRPIVKARGNSIIVNDVCNVYTANSARGTGTTNDFQLTRLLPGGMADVSFRFGAPGGDEFCHGVCQSQFASDIFFLCGESMSNNMLITKVDLTGTVYWSKEVAFPGGLSEAIMILPSNNNPFNQGYIAIGNCDDHIAAVKFDDFGNVLWKYEYSSNYSMEVTDAVVQHSHNDRIVTIVGNYYDGVEVDLFTMSVFTGTGTLFQQAYSYSTDLGIKDPQVAEVDPDMAGNIQELIVTFSKSNGAGFLPFQELGAMRIHGHYHNNLFWNYYYLPQQLYTVNNSDLIKLSNGRFSLLTEIHLWPHVMQMNDQGDFASVRSYNGIVTLTGGMAESCNLGYEVFNGQRFGSNELRVTDHDDIIAPTDCMIEYNWPRDFLDITTNLISIVANPVGTATNYNIDAQDVYIDDVLDCNGNPTFFVAPPNDDKVRTAINTGQDGSVSNDIWFYPNPAKDQLQLQLTADTQQITIYGISGEIMLTGKFGRTEIIDLSNFSSGVYFIEKTTLSGDKEHKKLIIE
ncbi:MAG: hypothetical protein ACI8ZM_002447 [Crocinitomix sp.]|jgi:hypothetical protein